MAYPRRICYIKNDDRYLSDGTIDKVKYVLSVDGFKSKEKSQSSTLYFIYENNTVSNTELAKYGKQFLGSGMTSKVKVLKS